MWVFTTDGFYSAVQHRSEQDMLIVRCRAKADAEALRNTLFLNGQVVAEVQHTPTADYEWRLHVPKVTWASYLATAVWAIDYSNFKDTVLERQGYTRASIYGSVWATMLDLQHETESQ